MTSQTRPSFTALSDREIAMTREFDAPPERLFQAFTDPEIIPQWWGLRELTTVVDELEVLPGGTWRYIQKDPEGAEYVFHGEYREVVPSERLVSTFEVDAMPGVVMVDTTRFETLVGGTRLTATYSFDTAEQLNMLLESGLEGGANDLWDRLGEYLAITANRS